MKTQTIWIWTSTLPKEAAHHAVMRAAALGLLVAAVALALLQEAVAAVQQRATGVVVLQVAALGLLALDLLAVVVHALLREVLGLQATGRHLRPLKIKLQTSALSTHRLNLGRVHL